MPLRSVEAYARAAELNESLASANLAQLYMKVGFAKEASEILDKASKKTGAHPNVGRAIGALAEKETSEEASIKELMVSAREQQRFIARFAEAFFVEQSSVSPFQGTWHSQEDGFELVISQNGKELKGTLDLLVEKLSVEGKASNRGARVNLSKKTDYFLPTQHGTGYLVLSENQLDFLTVRGSEYSLMVFTPLEALETE